ncbi:corticoliberin-like [Brachionichthys hirsutus]|uniref:corticoliberin-like n=1 Tax=Brachionichthys hirsutus TaxID=412623 RepID=UPI0036053C30
MKLTVPMSLVLLLAALLGCSGEGRPDSPSRRLLLPRPLLLHLGEEFSLQLGGGAGGSSDAAAAPGVNRALLRLTQRLLQVRAERQLEGGEDDEEEEEKGKRSEESPTSLDLTFHLLREVLEMARAEKIAQQADNNRKMMDAFGK